MADQYSYNELSPCKDNEIHEILTRIVHDPKFFAVLDFLFPHEDKKQISANLLNIHSIKEFQGGFMRPAIMSIIKKSSKGLTFSGAEYLKPGETYLFIANHRDILLDSALLQVFLFNNNLETSQISFGNNLMSSTFVNDICRVNKMFTVIREGTRKEVYENSLKLSAYIRQSVSAGNSSVWIAQRNGRTKDGNDKTQNGLLKMLNLSGKEDFVTNFRSLNIVPVSISYEIEPCDLLKVQELYTFLTEARYVKREGEDQNSILTGIKQLKGHIHLAICRPVNPELQKLEGNDVFKLRQLAGIIDQRIYNNYRLWPNNYIAADILNGTQEYTSFYTPSEKDKFGNYLFMNTSRLKGDPQKLKQLLLRIYANPVFNKAQAK